MKGDQAIERAADGLDAAAQRQARRGGLRRRLGEELADDAAFLRKLKPSLIRARAKGASPAAPPAQQLPPEPAKQGGGPNPLVVAAGALVAGILLAKLVDWRSHAHPRG